MLMSAPSATSPTRSSAPPLTSMPVDEREHPQDHADEREAHEPGEHVADDDAQAVRRAEHEPPREPALVVLGEAEAGEDAAERGHLQEARRRTGTPCSRRRTRSPGTFDTAESPPANASRKTSGNASDGTMIAGFLYVWMIVRRSTARATCQPPPLTCAAPACAARARRGRTRRRGSPWRPRCTGSSVLMSQPSMIRPRMPSMQEADRVELGDRAEPVLLDEVRRQVHRREEEEDEEQREHPLHRLAASRSGSRATRRCRRTPARCRSTAATRTIAPSTPDSICTPNSSPTAR